MLILTQMVQSQDAEEVPADAAAVPAEDPIPAEPEMPVEKLETDPPAVVAEKVPAEPEASAEEVPPEPAPVVAAEVPLAEEAPAEEPVVVAEEAPAEPPAAIVVTQEQEAVEIKTDPPVIIEAKPEEKSPANDEDVKAEAPVLKNAAEKEEKNPAPTTTEAAKSSKKTIVNEPKETKENVESTDPFAERKAPEQKYGVVSYIPLMLFIALFVVGLIVPYLKKKCDSRKHNANSHIEREPLNAV